MYHLHGWTKNRDEYCSEIEELGKLELHPFDEHFGEGDKEEPPEKDAARRAFKMLIKEVNKVYKWAAKAELLPTRLHTSADHEEQRGQEPPGQEPRQEKASPPPPAEKVKGKVATTKAEK